MDVVSVHGGNGEGYLHHYIVLVNVRVGGSLEPAVVLEPLQRDEEESALHLGLPNSNVVIWAQDFGETSVGSDAWELEVVLEDDELFDFVGGESQIWIIHYKVLVGLQTVSIDGSEPAFPQ